MATTTGIGTAATLGTLGRTTRRIANGASATASIITTGAMIATATWVGITSVGGIAAKTLAGLDGKAPLRRGFSCVCANRYFGSSMSVISRIISTYERASKKSSAPATAPAKSHQAEAPSIVAAIAARKAAAPTAVASQ